MRWKELSPVEAQKEYEIHYGGEFSGDVDIHAAEEQLSQQMLGLRKALKESYEFANRKALNRPEKIRKNYFVDLYFALKVYEIFSSSDYFLTQRDAANCDIWRYLTIKVVPDIIVDRWYGDNLDDHFYRKPNRIYLKVLWWYVHLSWQGNIQKTEEVLKNNNTDIILQLVERSGTHGYRLYLYRRIMQQLYFKGTIDKYRKVTDLFRKVMKLHTARSANIEPELANGSINGYVEELYNYFIEKETT